MWRRPMTARHAALSGSGVSRSVAGMSSTLISPAASIPNVITANTIQFILAMASARSSTDVCV